MTTETHTRQSVPDKPHGSRGAKERERKLVRRVTLWSAAVTAFMGTWGLAGSSSQHGAIVESADGLGATQPEQVAAQSSLPRRKTVVVVRREVQAPPSGGAGGTSARKSGGTVNSKQRPSSGSSGSRQASRPAPVTRSRGS